MSHTHLDQAAIAAQAKVKQELIKAKEKMGTQSARALAARNTFTESHDLDMDTFTEPLTGFTESHCKDGDTFKTSLVGQQSPFGQQLGKQRTTVTQDTTTREGAERDFMGREARSVLQMKQLEKERDRYDAANRKVEQWTDPLGQMQLHLQIVHNLTCDLKEARQSAERAAVREAELKTRIEALESEVKHKNQMLVKHEELLATERDVSKAVRTHFEAVKDSRTRVSVLALDLVGEIFKERDLWAKAATVTTERESVEASPHMMAEKNSQHLDIAPRLEEMQLRLDTIERGIGEADINANCGAMEDIAQGESNKRAQQEILGGELTWIPKRARVDHVQSNNDVEVENYAEIGNSDDEATGDGIETDDLGSNGINDARIGDDNEWFPSIIDILPQPATDPNLVNLQAIQKNGTVIPFSDLSDATKTAIRQALAGNRCW